ncbi:hypothetical protein SARC_00571 [Sphaeroforma arctica JP610]|uniref:B30.2/SPRY domain-containing protein n=1 Tax=Sphaeroforma arctica JP610 TaxID=667725 RepID=A0A0L0GE88_9EUKA|nr:hypothetical protein SARC_00571 [Sphaeroforma arctica JP610]KNC87330.1 hypothetical protein SARC_00571 [Sphaeroforma arctica JP610]|eukprot:XP_014161232.1 hypothetical protein SARC_00571 [Sphaeroforma arctica JP610]
MTWKQDEEGHFSVNGHTIKRTCDKSGDSKCNALWEGDGYGGSVGSEALGSKYWEVMVDTLHAHSTVWFGLTSMAHFKPGYGMKGMYFGGNLADGGGLLRSQWGPRPRQGDKIGMHAVATPSELKVRYYLNDECLGDAFVIPKSFPGVMYATVSLSKPGDEVTITQSESGTVPESAHEKIARVPEWPEGMWRSESDFGNGKHPTLNIKERVVEETVPGADKTYSVSCKCANSLNTYVNRFTGNGKWSSGPCMSTMMFSQEWVHAEQRASALLGNVSKVSEGDAGTLTIENETDGITETFVRYTPAEREPVTSLWWNV